MVSATAVVDDGRMPIASTRASAFRPRSFFGVLTSTFSTFPSVMRTPDDAIALREAVETGNIKRAVVAPFAPVSRANFSGVLTISSPFSWMTSPT